MTRGACTIAAARALLISVAFAGAALAQQPVPERQPAPQPNRARLEGEIRRGFARAVRERVGLSDEQMRRLAALTQKHEQQRRRIQQSERAARTALQRELRSGTPDTVAVARWLDSLLVVPRRRADMIEAEHRDLATVMTPVQRARYLALQEQVRRRVEELRQGGRRAAPGGGPPPANRRRPPA
jgi:Spy/CpxP family protein refolding chaperone